MADAPARPLPGKNRLVELDIVRGLALFGVFWVNLYGADDWIPASHLVRLPTAPLDEVVGFITEWLAAGKAQTLFTLLFGFGFAVMMERIEGHGANATAVYLRRLAVLLVIGVAHLLLLYIGDILHAYALMGFLLLLARRWKGWALLVVGLPLAILMPIVLRIGVDLTLAPGAIPPWRLDDQAAEIRWWHTFQGSDYRAYVTELIRSNIMEMYVAPTAAFFAGIFGRFLLGLWIFRQGWLQNVSRYEKGFRFWATVLIGAGLIIAGAPPLVERLTGEAMTPLLGVFLGRSSSLILALGYAAAMIVLCQQSKWLARFSGLRAVGQMALTNYLLQSFVYFFGLYGFGFGLLPYAGATFALLLAIPLFALQMAFSSWWLSRFRFGPVEWLWRCATYGEWQRFRIRSIAPPAPAR